MSGGHLLNAAEILNLERLSQQKRWLSGLRSLPRDDHCRPYRNQVFAVIFRILYPRKAT